MKTRLRGILLRLTNPRLLRGSTERPRAGEIKRIVVIRPDHLGDLLFATPALARLREAFPDARITGLVGPWGRAIWQGNPNLDALKVVTFPGIAGDKGGLLAPYNLLRRTSRDLARDKYDLGVTLRFDHWWGAALLAAARVPRRWGYDTPGMNTWLTDTVPYTPGKHEVEQNLALVDALIKGENGQAGEAFPVDRNMGIPALTPPGAVAPDLGAMGDWLSSPRRAIIHPGTMSANKLWTVAGWAEVANRLSAQGWTVALTGSTDERVLAAAIAKAAGEGAVSNFAGATANVAQLTWVLGQAHMVLGVDNGPLHIADALGKPTLHLYGPSDEKIWGPWGAPESHRAFRAPGTRPSSHLDIGAPGIEGGPEMRAITVDMVMREVDALIAATPDLALQ
jgi:heptosyltransferase-2/heptosyltransferase-3